MLTVKFNRQTHTPLILAHNTHKPWLLRWKKSDEFSTAKAMHLYNIIAPTLSTQSEKSTQEKTAGTHQTRPKKTVLRTA